MRSGGTGGAGMTGGHRAIGGVVALAATIGIVWASTARLTPHRADEGLLRLTWSARPERIETCRPQTEEELARLPAHMRQAVVCQGESAAYRLQVRRNGVILRDHVVHGGGWHRDRPLYVFQEIAQPAGDALISVRFERIGTASTARATSTENALHLQDAHVPVSLVLEQQVHFQPGRVILVTYDPDRMALTAQGTP